MFAGIFTIWNTIPKLKVECFQESIAEEMSLNHAKVIHRFITNSKFNPTK